MRTRAELREGRLATLPRPLGLVPTMGWLHDGHRALIERARAENATTVVTIFVNPRQFNVAADFRNTRATRPATSRSARPRASISCSRRRSRRSIRRVRHGRAVGAVARPLEGAARPGHFDGVATVVAILFDLVGAEHAYFGQKDAQQVMVIRQMARDLAIPTEVIACPTVREPDGLALSSRNVHLSPAERAAAPVLRRALLAARDRWAAGERSADALRDAMWTVLRTEPLADPDYVCVADGRTLAELDAGRRPGAAVAGGPVRVDPAHRQRAARLTIGATARAGPPTACSGFSSLAGRAGRP